MKANQFRSIAEIVVGVVGAVAVTHQFKKMRKNYRKETEIQEEEIPDEISDEELEAECE